MNTTFFVPDERKSGGTYVTRTSGIKKIDELMQLLVFTDDLSIPIENVLSLELIEE